MFSVIQHGPDAGNQLRHVLVDVFRVDSNNLPTLTEFPGDYVVADAFPLFPVSAVVGPPVDFQRDYGRTTYRGEVFPAEAVVQLELMKADAPPENVSDDAP